MGFPVYWCLCGHKSHDMGVSTSITRLECNVMSAAHKERAVTTSACVNQHTKL